MIYLSHGAPRQCRGMNTLSFLCGNNLQFLTGVVVSILILADESLLHAGSMLGPDAIHLDFYVLEDSLLIGFDHVDVINQFVVYQFRSSVWKFVHSKLN